MANGTNGTENNGSRKECVMEKTDHGLERRVVDAESARRMAARATDSSGAHSESHNFKCLEFHDLNLKGETLSHVEAHYSRFVNCCFDETDLRGVEFHFAELENCTFRNCFLGCSEFHFAKLENVHFYSCDLNNSEFPFAHGDISCTDCMMSRTSANNANLRIEMKNCNAAGFEGNFSQLEIDIAGSSLRRSEFNDMLMIRGTIEQTDLVSAELNRSDLSDLVMRDCATHGLETEDSTGIEGDDECDEIDKLFENDDEDEE